MFLAGVCALAGSKLWIAQEIQLSCFVHVMAAEISSIDKLTIISPMSASGTEMSEAMTDCLSLLASACPAIQQLQLRGDKCRILLSKFGASCPNLSCLKMIMQAASDTLEELQVVLPHLAHFCSWTAQQDDLNEADKVCCFDQVAAILASPEPSSLAPLPCACLTHVDIGMLALTPAIWHALPLCLQQLRCSGSINGSMPPAGLQMLASLRRLELYCPANQEIGLDVLASILRLAPGLNTLTLLTSETAQPRMTQDQVDESLKYLSMERLKEIDAQTKMEAATNFKHASINVPCTRDSISHINVLHNRLLAGLTVTCNSLQEENFAGMSLTLENCDNRGQAEFDYVLWLLNNLSSMPAFKGLEVAYQPSYQHKDPLVAAKIAATFPSLIFLRLNFNLINDEDLVHLNTCTSLQLLWLSNVKASVSGLSLLCIRLISLKVLVLSTYSGDGYKNTLQNELQAWGSQVKVINKKQYQ